MTSVLCLVRLESRQSSFTMGGRLLFRMVALLFPQVPTSSDVSEHSALLNSIPEI